jgi:threonine/homoserine/homoserine lactone efflux protein
MIISLLIGTVIGIILAMPPGPIAMANIKLGLEKSRKDCVQFSLGTALMDLLYCLIAIFAASAIESAISEYFISNPFLSLFFQFIVVSGLIFFGFKQVRTRKEEIESFRSTKSSKLPTFLLNLKNKGPLFLGISLAFTNLANPTFIPSLTLMSAWVHKFELFQDLIAENLSFSLGFGIGNFIWLYFLSWIVMRNRHKLSEVSILRIKQFAGVTFIGFGGFIGYRIVMFTNWAQIFKYAFVF